MAARLAVRYPQCKSAVYPPSLEAACRIARRRPLNLTTFRVTAATGARPIAPKSDEQRPHFEIRRVHLPAAGVVIILDVALNQQDSSAATPQVSCLAKHPNGTVVASAPGSMNASIHVWSAESSEVEPITEITLGRRSKGVQALDFSPDGKLLCCVDRDNHHTVTM